MFWGLMSRNRDEPTLVQLLQSAAQTLSVPTHTFFVEPSLQWRTRAVARSASLRCNACPATAPAAFGRAQSTIEPADAVAVARGVFLFELLLLEYTLNKSKERSLLNGRESLHQGQEPLSFTEQILGTPAPPRPRGGRDRSPSSESAARRAAAPWPCGGCGLARAVHSPLEAARLCKASCVITAAAG
jgi:hypothetical protein